MTATPHALDLTRRAAIAAADKIATDLVAFDVSERLAITDVFLLMTVANDRQAHAVVDAVEEELLRIGAKPRRREGLTEGRWILLDYIDLVVHIQSTEEREYYQLERIWKDCPIVPLPEQATIGRGPDTAWAGA